MTGRVGGELCSNIDRGDSVLTSSLHDGKVEQKESSSAYKWEKAILPTKAVHGHIHFFMTSRFINEFLPGTCPQNCPWSPSTQCRQKKDLRASELTTQRSALNTSMFKLAHPIKGKIIVTKGPTVPRFPQWKYILRTLCLKCTITIRVHCCTILRSPKSRDSNSWKDPRKLVNR